jgi:uncharacterized protein (DUF697 family)
MTNVETKDSITTDSADDRHDHASKIISSAMRWSAGAGAIPVPAIDLVALAAVQTRMLSELSELYGQSLKTEYGRATVSVLLGTLLPGTVTGALVGSAVKTVPVVGTLSGMASMAIFGAAATYAIAKVFVRHLEGGGSWASFSPQAVKDELVAEFSKGKAKAKQATA